MDKILSPDQSRHQITTNSFKISKKIVQSEENLAENRDGSEASEFHGRP